MSNLFNTISVTKVANLCTGDSNSEDCLDDGVYPFFDRSSLVKKTNRFLFDSPAIIVPGEGKDFYPRFYKGKFGLHQRAYALIPSSSIDPKFLYYAVYATKEHFSLVSVGSTVQSLRRASFDSLYIPYPSYSEQKSISEILSSLDDKIDLLNRQNATLEELAQTYFRRLFFIETSQNNECLKLDEWVTCVNGVSYKGIDLKPSRTALVTLKNFNRTGGIRMDGFKEYSGFFKSNHEVFERDLVVAHTDITQGAEVIGNPIMVFKPDKYDRLVISMDLVKVISKKTYISKDFLYFLMKTKEFKQHCIGFSNGSTVLHLSKKAIPSFEFPKTTEKKIHDFNIFAVSTMDKIFLNLKAIITLESLRDTLLPKLISGEVRVRQ